MSEMDPFASHADQFSDGSTEPSRERMQMIAALADGSHDSPELRAEIETDPQARRLLEEQRRAVALVRGAAEEVHAPDSLRERLASLEPDAEGARELGRRPRRPARRERGSRRWAPLAGLAGAVAAIALVLVLTLSGTSGSPTVAQAAALGTQPATLPAPRHISEASFLLNRSESGVQFPYWDDHFHFRASGARTDTIGGRHTTTVFYTDRHGRRLAYAIVSGSPLATPAGAQQIVRNGVPMWTVSNAGTTIVTWERDGHSCVLASSDVSARYLQALASWRAGGSIPY